MRASAVIAVCSLVAMTWGAASTYAQRVIFPTPASNPASISAGTTYSAGPAYSATPSFLGTPATAQAPSIYSTPYNYSAPGAIPPTAQPVLPGAAAPWDPYADPGLGTQPAFGAPAYGAPVDPYATGVQPYSSPFTGATNYVQGAYRETVRLLQALRAQHTWIADGNGYNDFDINTTELTASFGIPFGQIQQPILITPRFNFHWWAGPQSGAIQPPARDLPARVYDGFLETSWRPQFTPFFGADLMVAVGAYGDYTYADKNTVRVTGRGVGVFTITPKTQVLLGVWYINRDRAKLLPAGGVIFRPSPDTTFEMLFPNPRITQRITNYGATEVFGYLAGEYGGGQWTVTHQSDNTQDVINYNDVRLIAGFEAISSNRFRGNFDVGYVFNREILYRNAVQQIKPPDAVMLRMGLQY